MSRLLSNILILVGLCAAALAAVWLVTSDSRARLAALTQQIGALRTEEATLLASIPAAVAPDADTAIPEGLNWPQDSIGAVELAMQQAVLDAAAASNLGVVSFGSMGPYERCALTCATYEAELEGGHEQVAAFLAALETTRPALSVNSMWMRQLPPDGIRAIAPVSLRISLWGIASGLTEANDQ